MSACIYLKIETYPATLTFVQGHNATFHRGGFTRFSADITSWVKAGQSNELVVFVHDPTDSGDHVIPSMFEIEHWHHIHTFQPESKLSDPIISSIPLAQGSGRAFSSSRYLKASFSVWTWLVTCMVPVRPVNPVFRSSADLGRAT